MTGSRAVAVTRMAGGNIQGDDDVAKERNIAEQYRMALDTNYHRSYHTASISLDNINISAEEMSIVKTYIALINMTPAYEK